jgi:hypothetical protein
VIDYCLLEMSKESLLDKIKVSHDETWLRKMANICSDIQVVRAAANRAFDIMGGKK